MLFGLSLVIVELRGDVILVAGLVDIVFFENDVIEEARAEEQLDVAPDDEWVVLDDRQFPQNALSAHFFERNSIIPVSTEQLEMLDLFLHLCVGFLQRDHSAVVLIADLAQPLIQ